MDFGEIKIHPLNGGFFRLDGGAMFGTIPRVLWEKVNPPDEKNRIRLGINPLLIQTKEENILVDTGIGDKWDERFYSIYGVEPLPHLKDSLKILGLTEEDITIVINTHLHFDHAGGNTVRDVDGRIKPAFPNARYIVQKGEWQDALNPNERTRASYYEDDFIPLMEYGQLELIDGDYTIAEGVTLIKVTGHNQHMQIVKIESNGRTAIFLSDIVPTVAHLAYPYITGYDLFPLNTLRIKKDIISRAADEGWLLIFEHDPEEKLGRVEVVEDRPVFHSLKFMERVKR